MNSTYVNAGALYLILSVTIGPAVVPGEVVS